MRPSPEAQRAADAEVFDFIAEHIEKARQNACCALSFYDCGDRVGMTYAAKALAIHAKGAAMALNKLNAPREAAPAAIGGA